MRTPFLKLLALVACALAALATIADAQATPRGADAPAQKARAGKADWRADLRAMLPEAGVGKGDERVTKVALDETPRKLSGYLGGARIDFADDTNVSVYYLRAPRKASVDPAVLAVDVIFLSTPPDDKSKRTWFQTFGKYGNAPLACVRRAEGADKVLIVCGIADPEMSFLLATNAEYAGLPKEGPKPELLNRLVSRLQLARLLLVENAE